MPLMKVIGGKRYKLVKATPSKREANEYKDAYKGDYKVRVTKDGNVYHVWARNK